MLFPQFEACVITEKTVPFFKETTGFLSQKKTKYLVCNKRSFSSTELDDFRQGWVLKNMFHFLSELKDQYNWMWIALEYGFVSSSQPLCNFLYFHIFSNQKIQEFCFLGAILEWCLRPVLFACCLTSDCPQRNPAKYNLQWPLWQWLSCSV